MVEFVFRALTESSPIGDCARRVCEQVQALQVRRAEPALTGRGKLLPLHIQRTEEHPE